MVGQVGPLNVPPSQRVGMNDERDRHLSFRLIDFGRSHAPGVPTSGNFTANFTMSEETEEVCSMCDIE